MCSFEGGESAVGTHGPCVRTGGFANAKLRKKQSQPNFGHENYLPGENVSAPGGKNFC